jgi:thiamine biosynthesis lipoprotein
MAFCNLTEEDGKTLTEAVRKEIQRLEKMLNRFDPSGEIAIVNQKAGKEKVPVTNELFRIIQSCLDYNRRTHGYFDITIHSFNRYKNGIRGIIPDEKSDAVFFAHPDIQLDLGGFGKGYALDKCKTIVENHHCHDALLSFGNSSVLALGNHPLGEGWKVSLENNSSQSTSLYNECLTTSGNNHREKRHIISPISGKFIEQQRSISLKTSSGAWGEALSTAIFAALEDFPDGNPPFIQHARKM